MLSTVTVKNILFYVQKLHDTHFLFKPQTNNHPANLLCLELLKKLNHTPQDYAQHQLKETSDLIFDLT